MIDYKKELVTNLKTIGLPVHYERFLTKDTEVPCISYREIYNSDTVTGDTLGYSRLRFAVKIWAKDMATLSEYSNKIDMLMKGSKFTRTTSTELWQGSIGQNELVYEILGKEYFSEE